MGSTFNPVEGSSTEELLERLDDVTPKVRTLAHLEIAARRVVNSARSVTVDSSTGEVLTHLTDLGLAGRGVVVVSLADLDQVQAALDELSELRRQSKPLGKQGDPS